jgi:TctA family transporter
MALFVSSVTFFPSLVATGADVAGVYSRPLMEEYLRRAMLLSRGNPMVFLQRPISATLLALAVLAMLSVLLPSFSKTREELKE